VDYRKYVTVIIHHKGGYCKGLSGFWKV